MRNDCNESVKLWLYIDMSLSIEEKEKFERHLKECAACQTIYNEYAEAMELYRNSAEEVISESKFDASLAKAVSVKKRKNFSIAEIMEGALSSIMRHKMRAALAATLVIAGIIVTSLLNTKQEQLIMPKTYPAEEVMVWTSSPQIAEAADIKRTIELIEDDDAERFVMQNYDEDELSIAIYDLEKDLNSMEEEIDQNDF